MTRCILNQFGTVRCGSFSSITSLYEHETVVLTTMTDKTLTEALEVFDGPGHAKSWVRLCNERGSRASGGLNRSGRVVDLQI